MASAAAPERSLPESGSNSSPAITVRASTAIWWYVATAAIATALGLVYFHPWSYDASGIYSGGGDLLWTQAMFEVYGRVGPFGVDPALAAPAGFSPWSFPQLGMFVGVCAWLLVGVLGLPTVLAVMLVTAVVAGVCAAATLFLFRGLVGDRLQVIAATIAVSLGASVFVLSKSGHLSVALYAVVPLALGVMLRWPALSRRGRVAAGLCLVAAAVASPLWWVTVVAMIAAVMLLPGLLRRDRRLLAAVGLPFTALALGFAVQALVNTSAVVRGAAETRGPWDANVFGGHVSDLLLSSPFVNSHLPVLLPLVPGGSVERSEVGFVGGVCSVAVLVLLFVQPRLGLGRRRRVIVFTASLASVLFFLLGGLGNAQAALAVLLGGASPARVWARLVIVLAVLGAAWLLAVMDRRGWAHAPWLAVGLIVVSAAAWFADASATWKVYPAQAGSFAEVAAVDYLREHRSGCPVAQLPQDGMPMPRVWDGSIEEVDAFYYRGFIPYLLAPDLRWSFGSYAPEGEPSPLTRLGVTATRQSRQALAAAGYCAVLFDKQMAARAGERGLPVEGQDLRAWGAPDFNSDRFSVYLLG